MTNYQPRRALREDESLPEEVSLRKEESGTRETPRSPGTGASQPATTSGHGGDYLSHRQILVVLGGLMAGMFLAALDQSIVAVALPKITSELGGLDKLSWVVTAYLLTSTAATPLWGKISDLRGR
ncbi:MAG TPA: MFS transporter, partial [Propionibacteriaceae bacterium]|nr:MFS transporter [Propionibacteriaceae bacterium]